MIDNVYDADDIPSLKRINDLCGYADSIKPKTERVQAMHKILRVNPFPAHCIRNGILYKTLGIMIESRLDSAEITPNHSSTVVDMNRHAVRDDHTKAKLRNRNERSIYLLSTKSPKDDKGNLRPSEYAQACASGCLNNPSEWKRQLNNELDGLEYSRPTKISISFYHLVNPNSSIDVMMPTHHPESSTFNMTVIKNNEPVCAFDEDDMPSNSFTFVLSGAIERIDKNYGPSNNKVNAANIIADHINREANSLSIKDLSPDQITTSQDLVFSSQKRGPINKQDTIDNLTYSKSKEDSLNAKRDNVSLHHHKVPYEQNLSKSLDNSNENDEAKMNAKTITDNPEMVNNEQDLTQPLDKNGNTKSVLIKSNSGSAKSQSASVNSNSAKSQAASKLSSKSKSSESTRSANSDSYTLDNNMNSSNPHTPSTPNNDGGIIP